MRAAKALTSLRYAQTRVEYSLLSDAKNTKISCTDPNTARKAYALIKKTNDDINIVLFMPMEDSNQLGHAPKLIRSRDNKTFSMLNSAEHDIYPAHEC